MKNLIKILSIFAFSIFLSTASFGEISTLTEEQKVILEAHKKQNKENFQDFRSVLNVFQLAILETPELTRQEKREALNATLTLEQEALLEAHKILEREMKEAFKSTLTNEQKEKMSGIHTHRSHEYKLFYKLGE